MSYILSFINNKSNGRLKKHCSRDVQFVAAPNSVDVNESTSDIFDFLFVETR